MSSPEQLYQRLRSNDIPPLVLLCGQETFLIDRAARLLKKKVFNGEQDDFNDHLFHAKECSPDQILEAAMTYPVFAQRKLVTIKDAHLLSAADMETLLPYLDNPVPETCLLLIAGKIDSRRKFFQQFKKLGTVVEFKPLADKNLPQYVREDLNQRDFRITADAVAQFCGLVSASLYEIHTELDKLVSYLGDRKLIELKDVDAVVSKGRAENVFELGRAVGYGDAARALVIVSRLTATGEPPLRILSLLVRHFRQLWKVRELQVKKRPAQEIAKTAGVPFFVVDGLISQAKRFSKKDFMESFELFLEADLAMKSSGTDPSALLDALVLKLARMKD